MPCTSFDSQVGLYERSVRHTSKARRTLAAVACDGVSADSSVATRAAETVIYVGLAASSREADGTCALEGVYQVIADTAVEAGVDLALVYVYFTLCSCETWRTKHFLVFYKRTMNS